MPAIPYPQLVSSLSLTILTPGDNNGPSPPDVHCAAGRTVKTSLLQAGLVSPCCPGQVRQDCVPGPTQRISRPHLASLGTGWSEKPLASPGTQPPCRRMEGRGRKAEPPPPPWKHPAPSPPPPTPPAPQSIQPQVLFTGKARTEP